MPHIFRGRLFGLICHECQEPLANVTVRLYHSRHEHTVTALAVASPKDTFTVLTESQSHAKSGVVLADEALPVERGQHGSPLLQATVGNRAFGRGRVLDLRATRGRYVGFVFARGPPGASRVIHTTPGSALVTEEQKGEIRQ